MALGRPHLEYAVQVSFPHLQKDIQLIERMQRLVTRCVKSLRRLPYPECLHELKLPSMERHFFHASLITVYKLFHGYPNLPAEENPQLQVTSAGTTSRSVNHVFILTGGKRLLLFVRLDRGIDCLHTSLKLRQCPASRIAWMPFGAPFSLTLVDLIPLIVLMLMVFGAQVLLFRPVNRFDLI